MLPRDEQRLRSVHIVRDHRVELHRAVRAKAGIWVWSDDLDRGRIADGEENLCLALPAVVVYDAQDKLMRANPQLCAAQGPVAGVIDDESRQLSVQVAAERDQELIRRAVLVPRRP